MFDNRDRFRPNENREGYCGIASALVAGVGFFALAAFAGDYSLVNTTVVGDAFNLMSGNLGTP